jgi:hypothetical protein
MGSLTPLCSIDSACHQRHVRPGTIPVIPPHSDRLMEHAIQPVDSLRSMKLFLLTSLGRYLIMQPTRCNRRPDSMGFFLCQSNAVDECPPDLQHASTAAWRMTVSTGLVQPEEPIPAPTPDGYSNHYAAPSNPGPPSVTGEVPSTRPLQSTMVICVACASTSLHRSPWRNMAISESRKSGKE